MITIGILASLIGGGLAGGCVSLFFHRKWDLRALRTKFYPMASDLYTDYLIRMQDPHGRYWITTVGQNPRSEDAKFVDHRSSFLMGLVEFNELKEARILRKEMLDNLARGEHTPGVITKVDLSPEMEALGVCLGILHKKLGL